jgi:hypothetical protein
MNLLDPLTYLPGVLAAVAVGLTIDLAGWAWRRARPGPVRCARCAGSEGVEIVLRTHDYECAVHEGCLPELTVTLRTPFTGTWPDLARIVDDLEEATR